MEQCIATSVNCRCLKAPHSTDEAHQCEHGSWGGQRKPPESRAELAARALTDGARAERERILAILGERAGNLMYHAEMAEDEFESERLRLRATDVTLLMKIIGAT